MPPVICPVCGEELELENAMTASNIAAAPGIGPAMGISGDALLQIHAGQAMKRNQANLERHFATHKPGDWLPVLMEAIKQNELLVGHIESAVAHLSSGRDQFDKLANAAGVLMNLKRVLEGVK